MKALSIVSVSLFASLLFGEPPMFFLFGPSGGGKTFTAKALEKKLGLLHIDGDNFLTPEMQDAISEKRSFTRGAKRA